MHELPRVTLSERFSVKKRLDELESETLQYKTLSLAYPKAFGVAMASTIGTMLLFMGAVGVGILLLGLQDPALGDWLIPYAIPFFVSFPATMLIGCFRSPTERRIRAIVKQNRRAIRELQKEIDAFHKEFRRLDLLKDRTPRYAAIMEQCEVRYNELYARYRAIIDPVDAMIEPFREQQRRTREQERLQKDADELRHLRRGLSALLPSNGSATFTQDITPFVGVLEAEQRLDLQKQGLPADGSLWEPEADASAPPPDRDRE